jgi:hypothetical protein
VSELKAAAGDDKSASIDLSEISRPTYSKIVGSFRIYTRAQADHHVAKCC